MSRRKWAVVVWVAAALSLVAGACSRGSTGPGTAAIPTLEGTWRAYSGPNTLEFRDDHTWTLTTGDRVFSGKFAQADGQVVLLLTYANHPAYADFCRQDLDAYAVTIMGTSLVLRPAGTTSTDRAAGRQCNTVADQVFRNGPWTKEG